jgi:uncharacterized membrane protein
MLQAQSNLQIAVEVKRTEERTIIMDNIVVVVFENESKAYQGSQALREMEIEGSIHLYAKAVLSSDADGKVQVKQSSDLGAAATAGGLVIGALIGLLGGPVGAAIGAGVGTSGGFLYDMAHLGVSQDYLDGVGKSLKPGKAAVVAEIWEDWTLPVDTTMQSFGGVVFRHTRKDILDQQVERDITMLKAEIDELEAEHERASGEAKRKLQEKIDTVRAKLQTRVNNLQASFEASQRETETKIDSLQERAAKARGERKAELEKRIAELKAEQKRRSEQLKQAVQDIKKTLGV